jgi:putative ABC transport system permease protein
MQQTLADLEAMWKAMNIDSPLEYSFVDEDFANLYRAEQQIKTIVLLMSSLAIVIACLGLFGLVAFTAQQRTKEIGVRKVLGANVFGVVKLLSLDFLKLIVISIVIAVPLAWIISTKWLEGFAYKTEASWWIFALSALVAVIIALGTISIQAIKAALTNPVNSLRSE